MVKIYHHEKLIATVNLKYADQYLRGDDPKEYLFNLFTWNFAPQGFKYWQRICNGIYPLSHNAKAYIEMIIEEKKNQQIEERANNSPTTT